MTPTFTRWLMVYLLVGKWDRKLEGWRGDYQPNHPSTPLLWWSQTSASERSFSWVGLLYPPWTGGAHYFPKTVQMKPKREELRSHRNQLSL